MTVKCPKCQSDNPETQSFCGDCGTQLGTPKDISIQTKTLETPFPQFPPGTSLADRYEIIKELGKGGMGEVYLAEDTNLKRQVAIKVLPQEFALDAERLARFEREARLLASLNHPNIATIYGLEKSDDQQFLVMELVGGDTLAERIEKGPLSVDESLEICKQIAEGLESAHEKGIIHRDLKPANVKITKDEKVKILDFGLAKAFHELPSEDELADSPTITAAMTKPGVILGTAAYMSPEQAKGKSADKRADIWAFGCILFECLTGKKAFGGNTITETIASILKDEPKWDSVPVNAPGIVSFLLRRCLRKDVKKRLQDIGDARIEIEEAISEKPLAIPTVARKVESKRFAISWRITGLLLLFTAILVGVTTWWLTRSEITNPPRRFTIIPPSEAPLASDTGTDVAVSPDGKRLVYVASTGTSTQLYMRLMSEFEFTPLIGTKNSRMPFFSPDGEWLGHYSTSNQKLMKIPLSGGKPVPLEICSATSVFSAHWGSDDNIYFGSRLGFGIRRVSARGGEPENITTTDSDNNEIAHDSPVLLPDGNTLLYAIRKKEGHEESLIVAHDLKTGERRTLIKGGVNIQYVQTGHIAYNKAGTLLAAPFYLKRLKIGDWVPIVDDIRAGGSLAAEFALSREGTLVYVSGMTRIETYLTWIDNQGNETSLEETKNQNDQAEISPDGRYVALSIWDRTNRTNNIWIYDIQRRVNEQITYEGNNPSFVWSPDGKSIAYISKKEGTEGIYLKSLEGERKTEELWTSNNQLSLSSWSPDGNRLAFVSSASGNRDIWLYSFNDKKADPYLNTAFNETYPVFSPNGKWMAYTSNEQGPLQIFVRSLVPGEEGKIYVDGGYSPKWTISGDKLFYRSKNRIMAVSVATSPKFQLLEQPESIYESSAKIWDYDVHPKDDRLLLMRQSEEYEDRLQIRLVLNWFEELDRLSGQGKR